MKYDEVIRLLDSSETKYFVHDHEPFSTMQEVDEADNLDIDSSLKTMIFRARDRTIAAVLCGHDRIDYASLSQVVGTSRKHLRQMEHDDVSVELGDIPGGVGPFQHEHVMVIADSSMTDLGLVSCGSGRPDRTIEIHVDDLLRLSDATVAEISRRPT